MSNYVGRFDGTPGLVWYATVEKVKGADLRLGQWLDSLDHSGARMIHGLIMTDPDDLTRTVMFSFGDTEEIRVDVEYDVVDPNSQVTPEGDPMDGDDE